MPLLQMLEYVIVVRPASLEILCHKVYNQLIYFWNLCCFNAGMRKQLTQFLALVSGKAFPKYFLCKSGNFWGSIVIASLVMVGVWIKTPFFLLITIPPNFLAFCWWGVSLSCWRAP